MANDKYQRTDQRLEPTTQKQTQTPSYHLTNPRYHPSPPPPKPTASQNNIFPLSLPPLPRPPSVAATHTQLSSSSFAFTHLTSPFSHHRQTPSSSSPTILLAPSSAKTPCSSRTVRFPAAQFLPQCRRILASSQPAGILSRALSSSSCRTIAVRRSVAPSSSSCRAVAVVSSPSDLPTRVIFTLHRLAVASPPPSTIHRLRPSPRDSPSTAPRRAARVHRVSSRRHATPTESPTPAHRRSRTGQAKPRPQDNSEGDGAREVQQCSASERSAVQCLCSTRPAHAPSRPSHQAGKPADRAGQAGRMT